MTPEPLEAVGSAEISAHFAGLIASGRLAVGERLPTVRQTAADLGVAQGTAARAYKSLERDGLVVSRAGAGTRVAAGASVMPLSVLRSVRQLAAAARADSVELDTVVTALRAEWGDAG